MQKRDPNWFGLNLVWVKYTNKGVKGKAPPPFWIKLQMATDTQN